MNDFSLATSTTGYSLNTIPYSNVNYHDTHALTNTHNQYSVETEYKEPFTLSKLTVAQMQINSTVVNNDTKERYTPDLLPLPYIAVDIEGLEQPIAGMADTGAQKCAYVTSLL